MGSSGTAQQEGSRSAPDPRRETLAQRDDRNLAELVQELRVVSLGVQVLFGFLLSLPFTMRFSLLGAGQRGLYVSSLVLSAAATVLLLGPVAYHRILFRRGLKEPVVRYASKMAVLGLAVVGAAMLTAVLLVTSVVGGWVVGGLITAVMAGALIGLWFAVPLARRAGKLPRYRVAARAPAGRRGGHRLTTGSGLPVLAAATSASPGACSASARRPRQAGQAASVLAAGARLRRRARQKTSAPAVSTATAARVGPLAWSKARSASGPSRRPRTRWS